MVWAFQIAFLILLVLRVASKRHSTNEGTYVFYYLHPCYSTVIAFSFSFSICYKLQFLFQFILIFVAVAVDVKHNYNNYTIILDSGNPGGDFFADFIPANVPALARATQFFAILSYCIFADESIKDVVTAVETFPKFNKAKPDDKVWCMVFSCTLRFIQGMVSSS
jgi:hypothetical protein